MKKAVMFLVFGFAFMASVFAQTVGPDSKFLEVFNKALVLNEDRFADVNKIAVGDTVYFPARAGAGVEYWVADYPSYGVHDCIWRLTAKYLANQLPTLVADTTSKAVVKPVLIEETKESFDWVWLVICMCILFLLAAIYLPKHSREINRNPVLLGGLSSNPEVAKNQIQAIDRARQIVKAERGQLFGSTPAKVTMSFSDKNREVTLVNGDYAYRVTEHDGTVSYWRQHCGNLIHPIASGQFNLPDGWSFVPVANQNNTWSASESEKPEDAKPTVEEPVNKISDLEGLAKVLEVAGAMINVPSKITFGEIVIEFQTPEPSKSDGDQK